MLITRCYLTGVTFKSKCYPTKATKTIDRAIKLRKAKGWVVGERFSVDGHTRIVYVKAEDLDKYQSKSEERKQNQVKVVSYEPHE